MVLYARAWGSSGLPAKSRRRTSGKFFNASGLLRSRFSPAQTVSSLSWICFVSTFLKTMPPRRPLPIGKASAHFVAGWRYHKTIEGLEGEIRPAAGVLVLSLGAAEKGSAMHKRKAEANFRNIHLSVSGSRRIPELVYPLDAGAKARVLCDPLTHG